MCLRARRNARPGDFLPALACNARTPPRFRPCYAMPGSDAVCGAPSMCEEQIAALFGAEIAASEHPAAKLRLSVSGSDTGRAAARQQRSHPEGDSQNRRSHHSGSDRPSRLRRTLNPCQTLP
eukprot:760413-Rhodomonas_salina.2